MRPMLVLFVAIAAILANATTATAQNQQSETIAKASVVLNEALATTGHRIPEAMLSDAHAVAIIPQVIKGSFVVGARRGRGLLFIRESGQIWHAPVFITLTGGNIGWQIGVQSSDIVLVFKTPSSVQNLLNGKLTLGADAAAAAGPVGRQGAVATDTGLRAEIYTYSRSRGLFAGVSIDGSVLRIDQLATSRYYGTPDAAGQVIVPEPAKRLTQSIAAYAGQLPTPKQPVIQTPTAAPHLQQGTEADVLRGQLAQISPQLYEILDPQWKNYLALPGSVFLAQQHPTADEIATVIQRFDQVASNPQYRSLATRAEFQSVHGLLKHYRSSLTAEPQSLQLPPPPPR